MARTCGAWLVLGVRVVCPAHAALRRSPGDPPQAVTEGGKGGGEAEEGAKKREEVLPAVERQPSTRRAPPQAPPPLAARPLQLRLIHELRLRRSWRRGQRWARSERLVQRVLLNFGCEPPDVAVPGDACARARARRAQRHRDARYWDTTGGAASSPHRHTSAQARMKMLHDNSKTQESATAIATQSLGGLGS